MILTKTTLMGWATILLPILSIAQTTNKFVVGRCSFLLKSKIKTERPSWYFHQQVLLSQSKYNVGVKHSTLAKTEAKNTNSLQKHSIGNERQRTTAKQ